MPGRSPEEYYTTLGLQPGASLLDIKRAYRTLAKTCHPDRFAHTPHLLPQAQERFQAINQAYTALRRQHIAKRAINTAKRPPAPPPPPPPPEVAVPVPQPKSRRRPLLLSTLALGLCVAAGLLYLRLRAPTPDMGAIPRASSVLPASRLTMPQATAPAADETAPRPSAPASSTFTVGSTKAEVLATQGPPTHTDEHVWEYGGSRVYFRDARVTGWDEWPRSPLKAELRPGTAAPTAPDYFTVGSSKDEVLAVQGTPSHFSERVWEYGPSRVYFDNNRVVRWEAGLRTPLKARLLPNTLPNNLPDHFTVGSTRDEVLAIQGSPTRFTERVWEYGQSRVYFDNDRVIRWDEWRGSPLKARQPLTPMGG